MLATVAVAPSARADEPTSAIISNGVVQLGVWPEGHLNVPGGEPSSGTGITTVGLRYVPTGAEATADGCTCEGWGVAGTPAGGDPVSGYANDATDGGPVNLDVESFSATDDSAVSVVDVPDTLRVTHDYHPSAETPNLYESTVTIENVTADDVSDVRYRRVMDWDIEPTAFDEFSTIDGSTADSLISSSNDGFVSANPLIAPSEGDLGGPFVLGPPDGDFFTDLGPADHGAQFDFGFGTIPAGGHVTFRIFYGAAATEAAAADAVAAVGAEVWSFGQPDTEDGPTLGTPNTFIFGFSGVGGAAFAGSDARPPIALSVFGPGVVADGGAFDVTAKELKEVDGDTTHVTSSKILSEGLTFAVGDTGT
jgi:hypothetical protein